MQVLAVQAASSAQLAARPAARRRCAARRLQRVVVRAEQPEKTEVVDENIGEYCTLDEFARRPARELTLGEKEELFLAAMMSYYYDEKPQLSDAEFDNLKEELEWEGSKVVILSKEEKLLLEARMAYKQGRPIMSDSEYEALKTSLAGSSVFALPREGPTCTIGKPGEKGRTISDAQMDWGKQLLITVPPAVIVGGTLLGADLLTGGNLISIPGTTGLIIWCAIILPSVYAVAASISNFVFKDGLVIKGACPNCGEENTSYFGDILTVEGSRDTNTLKCPCCESTLMIDAKKRLITVQNLAG